MAIDPKTFHVELPAELIPLVDLISEGTTLNERIQVALAVGLFTGHYVSLSRAAELAGQSLGAFIDLLKERGIPWGEYTEEMWGQDTAWLKKARDDHGGALFDPHDLSTSAELEAQGLLKSLPKVSDNGVHPPFFGQGGALRVKRGHFRE